MKEVAKTWLFVKELDFYHVFHLLDYYLQGSLEFDSVKNGLITKNLTV